MVYPRTHPTVVGGKTLQHHLYFDDMADYPILPPLSKVAAGSDAYCLETQDVYILSEGSGLWEVQ